MIMRVLPPGTLLQLMYFQERLNALEPGSFIEIGAGGGDITHALLDAGWTGTVYDLEKDTVTNLERRFANAIADGRLRVVQGDYLEMPGETDADLIISCMVMEHLDDTHEQKYVAASLRHLRRNGRMIGLVPAGMRYWGIEDDIAGHCRRYEREDVQSLLQGAGWQLQHIAGLTFPISNCLLPLSNYLVKRAETNKLQLSELEKTKLSGKRNVAFKTRFPALLGILLNSVTMQPLHWIQKMNSRSERAMVLYFEATPPAGPARLEI